MRKKFIILLLMSIFLIGAVSFISAADEIDDVVDVPDENAAVSSEDVAVETPSNENSVNVNEKVTLTISIDWKDNNSPNRPTSITVFVMDGNKKVETVVLSSNNNWSKTVELDKYDVNGNEINYSVSQDRIGSYNNPVISKNDNSFKITNELKEVLSSSSPQNTLKENNSDNGSADNQTQENTSDNNSTENKTVNNNTIINNTVNNNTIINKTIVKNNTSINNTTINNVLLKKPVHKDVPKKDSKDNKNNILRHAGNPILILLVAVIVAGVAYYFYNKR